MSGTPTSSYSKELGQELLTITALAALEQDPHWLIANGKERTILKRIAAQRDRLNGSKQSKLQPQSLQRAMSAVPIDAPFGERLLVFAKLHPIMTATAAGLALMIGPRKLVRWGAIVVPLVTKLKR